MKIKVFTNSKGTILSALLPPEGKAKYMTECGPMITGKKTFVDIDLPKGTRLAAVPDLLARSCVKQVKKTPTLDISKKPTKPKKSKK